MSKLIVKNLNLISKLCIPDPPVFKKITVTILGACVPLGRTVALLLKQCKGIDYIKLYGSDEDVCATAVDLSSIDTSPKVLAYQGNNTLLIESIKDANIVVICGGDATNTTNDEEVLFNRNVDGVRYLALHISEYSPKAIVVLATPPVNSFVPLICEEFKKAKVFDHRKIVGVSNVATMRANSLIGEYMKKDPSLYMCPTIGGMSPRTMVPVFSQTSPPISPNQKDKEQLLWKIRNAETKILKRKFIDNSGSCYLTMALAITRYVKNQVDAMRGDRNCFECAFVPQVGHIGEFLSYMATICKLGPHGVEETLMPKLDAYECEELRKGFHELRAAIRKGVGFVTGERHREGRVKDLFSEYCSLLERNPVDVVGDITVDLSKKYRLFKVYQ